MAFVLVYGAENFVIEIVAGWAYAAVVVYVIGRLADQRARRVVAHG